jgi:two-component system NtrC family sensor kinase
MLAGAWLGAGPALLVGAITGVLRAGATTGGIADPFHMAFLGFLAASCMRQDYRGRLETMARRPLVASLLATPVAAFLLLLSVWAHVSDSGLAGVDYAVQVTKVRAGFALFEALSAAVPFEVLLILKPSLRPVRSAHRPSVLRRSLNRELLVVVVPVILVMTLVLVYAATAIALRGAREQAVQDLAREAYSAADEIPNFVHTGQGLLGEFVRDARLLEGDSAALERLLKSDLRVGTFFDQLMLFDPGGQVLAMYPPAPTGDPALTAQEQVLLDRVLDHGAPQISSGHQSHRDEALVSFLTPTSPTEGVGGDFGALVGRTHLQVNPVINRVLTDLQRTSGRGEGFVVDSEGRIIAHPDASMVLSVWKKDRYGHCVTDATSQGKVCEGRNPVRNTRELLYHLPAEGYPWAVVIRLPYEVVLEQAEQVAVPLLGLQTIFGAGLVAAVVLVVGRTTHPLKQLANAAERIASGTLTEPISVRGCDEVGRLGTTLEDMRSRLKARMSDLSLLLEVSQAVSSTLELSTGMSFVLEGAVEATEAEIARAILIRDGNGPTTVVSRGAPGDSLTALDRVLVAAVEERQAPVFAKDLARAKSLADAEALGGTIRTVVALPVRTQERTLGVVWIGYRDVTRIGKSKIDFLSMLTSQAAVLVENARLFQAVESERSRLAAILESTSDAVLVTDAETRLLLVNPAAEQAFDVCSEALLGRRMDETDLAAEVVEAASGSSDGTGPSKEVVLPDGRVLYANVSTVSDSGREQVGRVAVLRDVTHFKDLDEMKSQFLATVSHDLRAPLTYMRGYANRLGAVGELNPKQRSYVDNILRGVQRIDELVTDLLDLSRIEAGLGVERGPCHLGLVLGEAVSTLRSQADAKNISLTVQPPTEWSLSDDRALVSGDRALLRQAIVNLLDNAIKYTPEGGSVAAELSVDKRNGMNRGLVTVADTGIGIAPEEQLRLFEKFYRTKRGDKSGASGTGLGLAIVKSIVERHDGRVWVDSKLNEGTKFHISLPLLDEESVHPALFTQNIGRSSRTQVRMSG